MAVATLHDATHDLAVLYCTTSDWTLGPVFGGPDADEKAESFLEWFTSGAALEVAGPICAQPRVIAFGGGRDPRDYDEIALERQHAAWRAACTDDDGNLLPSADDKEADA